MKKQNKVPKSRVKKVDPPKPVGSSTFDVGRMAFNYLVAFHLQRHFVEIGHPLQMHFGGIINGYDDWFTALNIDQETFDSVYEKLPREQIQEAVQELIPKFKEQYDKAMSGEGKIIVPGQSPKSSKQLMDQFKDLLRSKGQR